MTVGPASAPAPGSAQRAEHSPLARWAVGLAVGGAALVAVAAILLAAVGEGLGAPLTLGAAAALAAFVLAIVVLLRRERWALLALPLGVLPLVAALFVLGELFWWE